MRRRDALITMARGAGLLGLSMTRVRSALAVEPRAPIPDGLVVLTFDDSVKSHATVAAPLLARHGFNATFFITEGFTFATNKRDYLTWDEIRGLHDAGFEIGNHTRDHLGITPMALPRLKEQLVAIDERCVARGIPRPVSFAWPGNALTPEALPILKSHGILWARRGGQPEFPYEKGEGRAYEPGVDHPLLVPSTGDARPAWTVENLRKALDQARGGKICILQFHGVPEGEHPWVNTPKERFEEYVGELARRGCQVIALRDLSRYVDPQVAPVDPFAVIQRRIELRKQEIPAPG